MVRSDTGNVKVLICVRFTVFFKNHDFHNEYVVSVDQWVLTMTQCPHVVYSHLVEYSWIVAIRIT